MADGGGCRIAGLEWSDIVLLCDTASRKPELAARLREWAVGDCQAVCDDLAALDHRTAGRRRRLQRAFAACHRDDGELRHELRRALVEREAFDSSAVTLVCTHHKENFDWAVSLMLANSDVTMVVYDCGIYSAPLPAALVGHPRVHVRDKIGALTQAPFFYSCFDFCASEYERLPPCLLFLHGHDRSWHQKLCVARLLQLCEAARREDPQLAYANLNDRIYSDWVRPGGKMLHQVADTWSVVSRILGEEASPPPSAIYEVHAAQAMADRARIRARPRAVWGSLCRYASTLRFHSTEDLALEGAFHRILGEPWVRPFVRANLPSLAAGVPNELEIRCGVPTTPPGPLPPGVEPLSLNGVAVVDSDGSAPCC